MSRMIARCCAFASVRIRRWCDPLSGRNPWPKTADCTGSSARRSRRRFNRGSRPRGRRRVPRHGAGDRHRRQRMQRPERGAVLRLLCQTALNIDPGSTSNFGSDSLPLMPTALRLRTSTMEPQHAPSLPIVEPRTCWIRRRSSRCRRRPDRSGREVGSRSDELPGLPDPFASHLKPLPAPCRRLAARWPARRAPDRRTTLLVRRSCLQAEDLCRAFSRRRSTRLRATHLAAGADRPSRRSRAWRSARCGPRPASHAAGQSRHTPARRPPSGDDTVRSARRHRHRRLRLATQPPLRHPGLRSRTQPHRGAATGSRAGHRADLAEAEHLDPNRRPRPWRRIW